MENLYLKKPTCSDTISGNISLLLKTKNPKYLVRSLYLLYKTKRINELLFGLYNFIFHSPSCVRLKTDYPIYKMLEENKHLIKENIVHNREEVVSKFKNNYAVNMLPDDFHGVVKEAILQKGNALIIGEYGRLNKRIFYVNDVCCKEYNYYTKDKDVIHIHAINNYITDNEIVITTGDTGKYLDLWSVQEDDLVFNKRLKKKLAGYMAITILNKCCYFGSDFSNRPNFIATIDQKKFFYPKKAYKMFTAQFITYQNRYIISVNSDLIRNIKSVAIFDSHLKEFIFCEYLDSKYLFLEKENTAFIN